jgi:flagellar motor switch protein FliG
VDPKVDPEADKDPLRALGRLDPERLTLALQGENPRPIALVLSYLDVERAGVVFKRLPAEVRREVALLLGTSNMPGIDVARRIAQALLEKSQAVIVNAAADGSDRMKRLADMLRLLDKADRMEVLAAMEQREPAAAAAVREHLYVFEDLLALDNRSMQKVLGEVDPKGLATALKGAAEAIQEKVLSNLSQRAQEALKEEMEFLTAVPAAQQQQAQKFITDVVQRLDVAGELTGLD